MKCLRKTTVYMDMGMLGDRDLDVEYHYFKGEKPSRDCPGEPEEFWIASVKADDVELYDLLTDEAIDTIKFKICEEGYENHIHI